MSASRRIPFLFVLFLLSRAVLGAKNAIDPSGHWEGVIHVPSNEVIIEVDVARDAHGALAATFNNPSEQIRAFPLANVALDGAVLTFAIKATGGGVFRGTLGADGQSMKGTFTAKGPDAQPIELPFDLKRVGDAKIEATQKSAAVGKELEGNWSGTLDVQGTPHQVGLSLLNHADGTATGKIRTNEGTEIPITLIIQKGSSVTLEVKNLGGTYAGTLRDGALVGTWTQGPFVGPLTFQRASAGGSGSASKNPVVERWANAVGGRAKVASIQSTYREATIEVGGYQGTIKAWHSADGKYRKEEQVGPFSTIETFDGTNGMLQKGDAPPQVMAGAELERARSTPFANWNAVFFVFLPERHHGTIAIEGDDTIVLKPEGGIDWRVTLDPQTSLPKSMTHQEGQRTVTVTFASYETVDGVRFEKEIHRSTGDPRWDAVIRFTKTVLNPQVDASLFSIAPKRMKATQ
jgi:hypothetical protein